MAYFPELSVNYLTYLKSTIQQGLADIFAHHPDPLLRTRTEDYQGNTVTRGTKVTLEFPRTKDRYPAVVVRFFERNVSRMGVGHQEYIRLRPQDKGVYRMFHDIYDGDLEFAIYGLSNYDRDVISDTVVQAITMGQLDDWANRFVKDTFGPLYDYEALAADDLNSVPLSHWNFISINQDTISGFGETQAPAPWGPEDEQLYLKQYRVAVMGEFYSIRPDLTPHGFVEKVPVYPYVENLEPVPEGDPDDPADWQEGWY
jgi:hypothetical protein